MIISHEQKFIFFHLYKVAGTSINTALSKYANVNTINKEAHIHPALLKTREFSGHSGRELFKKYFTFAFVRNPWDWEVSLHSFMMKYGHPTIKQNPSLRDFTQYVKWRVNTDIKSPQYTFLSDGYDLKSPIGVDFVGKFEHLNSDFAKICEILKLQCPQLQHRNKTKHSKYVDHYTDETRKLIENRCQKDINYFGYEFGSNNTPSGQDIYKRPKI